MDGHSPTEQRRDLGRNFVGAGDAQDRLGQPVVGAGRLLQRFAVRAGRRVGGSDPGRASEERRAMTSGLNSRGMTSSSTSPPPPTRQNPWAAPRGRPRRSRDRPSRRRHGGHSGSPSVRCSISRSRVSPAKPGFFQRHEEEAPDLDFHSPGPLAPRKAGSTTVRPVTSSGLTPCPYRSSRPGCRRPVRWSPRRGRGRAGR